jgi:hypothetical protein
VLVPKSDGSVIEGNKIGTQGHTGNSEVFRAKKLKTEFRRAIQIIFSSKFREITVAKLASV